MLVTKTKTPENKDPLFSLLRHDLVMVSHRKYPSPVLLFLIAVRHAIKQRFYIKRPHKRRPKNQDTKTKSPKQRPENKACSEKIRAGINCVGDCLKIGTGYFQCRF